MKTQIILNKAIKTLDNSFKRELIKQGHSLTRSLENSIKGKVSNCRAEGYMLDYGFIVNNGIKADRIPFSGRGHSNSKTSKYINALTAYFITRGLPENEAKRAAFATANVQKKEGMSTSGSKKYSRNKQRQNFLDNALENVGPKVDKMFLSEMENIFEKEFSKQKNELI